MPFIKPLITALCQLRPSLDDEENALPSTFVKKMKANETFLIAILLLVITILLHGVVYREHQDQGGGKHLSERPGG